MFLFCIETMEYKLPDTGRIQMIAGENQVI